MDQKKTSSFFLCYTNTAWKVSKYGVHSGSYFPVFWLNADIHGNNLRIQSEYRKIRASYISRSVNLRVSEVIK